MSKLEIALFVFFAVLALLAIFWSVRTEKRLGRFFAGKKGHDLEASFVALKERIAALESKKDIMEREMEKINQKLRRAVRGLEVIRFNPFPDQGSNQSFAAGFLNENGDGVIFSSLYSRERMSVFAKPVKGGKSEYELSEEERAVLEKAKV